MLPWAACWGLLDGLFPEGLLPGLLPRGFGGLFPNGFVGLLPVGCGFPCPIKLVVPWAPWAGVVLFGNVKLPVTGLFRFNKFPVVLACRFVLVPVGLLPTVTKNNKLN